MRIGRHSRRASAPACCAPSLLQIWQSLPSNEHGRPILKLGSLPSFGCRAQVSGVKRLRQVLVHICGWHPGRCQGQPGVAPAATSRSGHQKGRVCCLQESLGRPSRATAARKHFSRLAASQAGDVRLKGKVPTMTYDRQTSAGGVRLQTRHRLQATEIEIASPLDPANLRPTASRSGAAVFDGSGVNFVCVAPHR